MCENEYPCPICGNKDNNKTYNVKEMMIGLREEFLYVECANCKCLYLNEIPENIGDYYDSEYGPHRKLNSFKNNIVTQGVGWYLSNNLISKVFPKSYIPPIAKLWNSFVKNKSIDLNSSILDVGCGNGQFLYYLKKGGFKDLTGIDLFFNESNIPEGIAIKRDSLETFKTTKKFDVILSHHSFEHMDEPLKNLTYLENLLSLDGFIILCIPIKSEPIWDKYGVNWHQIDAPRHFFLYSLKSLEILVGKTNLYIDDIVFDSSYLQFTCSEKFSKDIARFENEWDDYNFTNDEINNFKNETIRLNENKQGDQAIFILKFK